VELAAGGGWTWPEGLPWTVSDLARVGGSPWPGWKRSRGRPTAWRPCAPAAAPCRPAATRWGGPGTVLRVQGGARKGKGRPSGAGLPRGGVRPAAVVRPWRRVLERRRRGKKIDNVSALRLEGDGKREGIEGETPAGHMAGVASWPAACARACCGTARCGAWPAVGCLGAAHGPKGEAEGPRRCRSTAEMTKRPYAGGIRE
jgi:hypothetical protein